MNVENNESYKTLTHKFKKSISPQKSDDLIHLSFVKDSPSKD